jgi:hypothetical protein
MFQCTLIPFVLNIFRASLKEFGPKNMIKIEETQLVLSGN